jgi:hypothetical protein
MTLPLAQEPDMELSIFRQAPLWDAMNRGLHTDDRIVAIVHAPSRRREDRRFASPVSEHRIVLGAEQDDLVAGDAGPRPIEDHKIGGRPYCVQEPELEGAEALQGSGIVQLVQLDFVSPDDADVEGGWPFSDGMFNLFGAPPFDVFHWAFQK